MFGNDLSRSVISTVYQQNEGDVAQAVDMLLDIYHDEDAIEAIRTMGAQQKKKVEAEMKAEQEKRNAEQKVCSFKITIRISYSFYRLGFSARSRRRRGKLLNRRSVPRRKLPDKRGCRSSLMLFVSNVSKNCVKLRIRFDLYRSSFLFVCSRSRHS